MLHNELISIWSHLIGAILFVVLAVRIGYAGSLALPDLGPQISDTLTPSALHELFSSAPGPIADTEGVRRLLDEASTRRATEATPLRRLGLIDDVAAASLFLCSQAASYVTGHTLVVDGGLWLSAGRSPFAAPPSEE